MEDIELLTAAGVAAKAIRREVDDRLAASESRNAVVDRLDSSIAADGDAATTEAGQLG